MKLRLTSQKLLRFHTTFKISSKSTVLLVRTSVTCVCSLTSLLVSYVPVTKPTQVTGCIQVKHLTRTRKSSIVIVLSFCPFRTLFNNLSIKFAGSWINLVSHTLLRVTYFQPKPKNKMQKLTNIKKRKR